MIRASVSALTLTLSLGAVPARALPALPLLPPEAQTATNSHPNGGYDLPVGPWEDGKLPTLSLTGLVEAGAWRLTDKGNDSRDMMARLRADLAVQGFQPIFTCATDGCGGFDFRYRLALFAEPDMHVDLGDYRYLAAVRGKGDQADYIALMVSRIGETGFVQMTEIHPSREGPVLQAAAPATDVAAPLPAGFVGSLEAEGHQVLEGLDFASGATDLAPGEVLALQALADYLASRPEARVMIVGHTDASGDPAANVALSRARAEAVMARLVAQYKV
ncbi:MAG: OmpA family protein, partial [Rhodobacteraceae bacterium]|nr:OmpA family protein [Paracoccaceae bacterium]